MSRFQSHSRRLHNLTRFNVYPSNHVNSLFIEYVKYLFLHLISNCTLIYYSAHKKTRWNDRVCAFAPITNLVPRGLSVKVIIHLHVLPRLIMRGDIPQPHSTPSWFWYLKNNVNFFKSFLRLITCQITVVRKFEVQTTIPIFSSDSEMFHYDRILENICMMRSNNNAESVFTFHLLGVI
jgi:hypothetical protein